MALARVSAEVEAARGEEGTGSLVVGVVVDVKVEEAEGRDAESTGVARAARAAAGMAQGRDAAAAMGFCVHSDRLRPRAEAGKGGAGRAAGPAAA